VLRTPGCWATRLHPAFAIRLEERAASKDWFAEHGIAAEEKRLASTVVYPLDLVGRRWAVGNFVGGRLE